MKSYKYFMASLLLLSACKPSEYIGEFQSINDQIDHLVIRNYGDSSYRSLQATIDSVKHFCRHKPSSPEIQRYQSASLALISLHLNQNRNNEAFAAVLLTYINAKAEVEARLYRPALFKNH